MPVSKKRKKKGKPVTHDEHKMSRTEGERPSGVTLQDLINMVAYQEYQQAGIIDGPEIPDNAPSIDNLDFEDADTQAVIRAVHASTKDEEIQDGRQ